MPANLIEELREFSKLVRSEQLKLLDRSFKSNQDLLSKLKYATRDIGLRIRPFLVLAGYRFGRRSSANMLPIALGIELLQASTLIVDDILDRSPKRNGKKSVYAKWGISNAILIAEMLKTLSATVLSEASEIRESKKYEIISLIEWTYKEICCGQMIDIDAEAIQTMSEEKYLKMISKTTARFIQSALVAGALAGEVSMPTIKALMRYGLNIGLAYQIRDDVIDLIGDEEFTGKSFAEDIFGHKKRLPLIYAQANCRGRQKRQLYTLLEKKHLNLSDARKVVAVVLQCGGVQYSILKTKRLCRLAMVNLAHLPEGREKKKLVELANLISDFGYQGA